MLYRWVAHAAACARLFLCKKRVRKSKRGHAIPRCSPYFIKQIINSTGLIRAVANSLFVIFTLNEFIPSTAHSIAFALYEGTVLTLAAAEAIGLGELIMGAVILTQTVREKTIKHAVTEAACTHIANQHKIQHTEGAALTA